MFPKLIVVILTTSVVFCDFRVEYLNDSGEALVVTLLEAQKDVVLQEGETYLVTYSLGINYGEVLWAKPAKCQNETCDYPYSIVYVAFDPLTDDVNETVGQYAITPDYYNRGYIIQSLDNPNCPVASCEIDLVEDCPPEHQIRDEDDIIVACDIFGVADYSVLCPNFGQWFGNMTWNYFYCQGTQQIRVTIK